MKWTNLSGARIANITMKKLEDVQNAMFMDVQKLGSALTEKGSLTMVDRNNVIKDNAIRGLQSAIEISGALVHLRKEHAKAILALLKEQEDEKKRIMKVIWDTLHEGLSIDTVADQDWVYERIRHRIEDA